MLKVTQDDDRLVVQSRSVVFGVGLFCLLVFLVAKLSIDIFAVGMAMSETIGGLLGMLLCVVGIYYFVEFATFSFSNSSGLLTWRSRSLFRNRTGEVALRSITRVRRDAHMSTDGGYTSTYRLVVVTDQNQVIPLTRSFSGTQDQQLDEIVQQVRAYLGMPLN